MKPDRVGDFVREYGSGGTWDRFFRQAEGFLGTDLWSDPADSSRFLTIDRWTSSEAYGAFSTARASEYSEIDARMEQLTVDERRLVSFESG